MDHIPQNSLDQVKDLLHSAMFATMATVNADGTPHNSPFFLLYDHSLEHIFWGSHPDSVHSQNILRTGEIYVVIYNSHQYSPGLYIQAHKAHPLVGNELEHGLEIHNQFRAKHQKPPIALSYYVDGPQKMWSATTAKFWINGRENNEAGQLVKDIRTEVLRKQLISE